MMSRGLCCAWGLLLSALPLLVEGGFPKAAKTTLNLTLSPNSKPSREVNAFGKLVLSLRKGATISFRGHCEGSKVVFLSYWLITSDCVGQLDDANYTVLQFPKMDGILRHKTDSITVQLNCNDHGGYPIHPKNITKDWSALGNEWNALCGSDEANTTSAPAVATAAVPAGSIVPPLNGTTTALNVPKTNGTKPAVTLAGRRRREASPVAPTFSSVSTTKKRKKMPGSPNLVCKTRTADVHALVFAAWMDPPASASDHTSVYVTVQMKNEWGYLSAIDHPNLAFYAVMTALYSVLAFIWLVLLLMQYQDLLRIQFWIGGVIGLGMFEKALFLAEYNTVNESGHESAGLMVFAELVSTGKRTLARLLVIIVSMGFGIVKPRLGPMLPRVLAVGVLYFVAGSIDSTGRATHNSETTKDQQDLATTLVLTVVDVGICWWIFLSLHGTMRTLRLRRNLVKLSLYRHFTNALVFSVIASVAFMVWDLRQFRLTKCITDWSELWLRSGFWHILFSFILIIIMILWRPTANNNRYAYSPLIDLGSNDEPEQMPSDAFEGMKLRNTGGQVEKRSPRSVDDDLKWVEENIPTATAESALPSLLDSDEELMTTKFEMSKIQ